MERMTARTEVSMQLPTPRRGGFFQALHACALDDGVLSRVIDAFGIGPTMGINDERDLASFESLARVALYNMVAGCALGGRHDQDMRATKARRLRMLDPSAPLSRAEVDIAMSALDVAGIPCVLHPCPGMSCRVKGAINLWRSSASDTDSDSPPCTPPVCCSSSSSDEDEEDAVTTTTTAATTAATDEWASDTYGPLPWRDGVQPGDDFDRVSQTAASTVVRLPRALLAPFAKAFLVELDKLGVECSTERLAEARSKVEAAEEEVLTLKDLATRLGERANNMRNANSGRLRVIKELKITQERLEAEIKLLNNKSADTYAVLIVAREDAMKATAELNLGMTMMRAESTAAQTEAAAVVARKATSDAALKLVRAEMALCDEELRAATEAADNRKRIVLARLEELAADRASAQADIDRTRLATQACVMEAVDARVSYNDALAEITSLRRKADGMRKAAVGLRDGLREEAGRLREEAGGLREEAGRLREEAGGLREEAGRLREDVVALKAAAERVKDEQQAAAAEVDAATCKRDALQAESAAMRTRIEELLHERQRQAACCGRVMSEVEVLTERHQIAVRARLNAGAACRRATAQANAALQEAVSLESKAAFHRFRANKARDEALEAESAAFRAKVQRDLVPFS